MKIEVALCSEQWAVVHLAGDQQPTLVGSATSLDEARTVAEAWWALRLERGLSLDERDAVVVTGVSERHTDTCCWHARLEAAGWRGAG